MKPSTFKRAKAPLRKEEGQTPHSHVEKNNPKQTNLGRKKDTQLLCHTSASVADCPGVALGFQSGSREKVPPPSASTPYRSAPPLGGKIRAMKC